MTTPVDPGPAQPQEPGFFSREAQRLLPHVEHAEAGAGRIAADVLAAIQGHAGQCYDVAGDCIKLLELIDPADAPLFAAASALVPKVLEMVERATALAQARLPAAPGST